MSKTKTLRKNQPQKSKTKTKKYILFGGSASFDIIHALKNYAVITGANLSKYNDNDPTYLLANYLILNQTHDKKYGYLFIETKERNKETLIKDINKHHNYPNVFLGVPVAGKMILKPLENKGVRYEYKGDLKKEIKTHTQVLDPVSKEVKEVSATSAYTSNPAVKEKIDSATQRKQEKQKKRSKSFLGRTKRFFGFEESNSYDFEEEPPAAPTAHGAAAATSHGASATTAHGAAATTAHGAAAPVADDFSIVVVSDLEDTFQGFTVKEFNDNMLNIFDLTQEKFDNLGKIEELHGSLWFTTADNQYNLILIDNRYPFLSLVKDNEYVGQFMYIYRDRTKDEQTIYNIDFADNNEYYKWIKARFNEINPLS